MVTWEAHKRNTLETAHREMPHKTIELIEWHQGLAQNRCVKAPSLWSHETNSTPTSVEKAATNYFRSKGWIVSPTPFRLLNLFGIAEAIASLEKDAEENFEKLENNLLLYQDVCKILRSNKPSKPERFEYWFQRIYDQRIGIHELNSFEVLGPSDHGGRSRSIVDADNNEIEFNFLRQLHQVSPRQTWQTAYLINRERLRKHGTFAGIPDLLIWKDNTYSMVEVKSPSDSIQLSQALFYCTVTKPLSINFFIADIIPARAHRK